MTTMSERQINCNKIYAIYLFNCLICENKYLRKPYRFLFLDYVLLFNVIVIYEN